MQTMKKAQIVIWVFVLIMAGVLGWMTLVFSHKSQEIADGPYGVPFTLTDQNGKEITQAAFASRPTALFFGYTHCPDVCPTTLFELDGWLKKVDPDGTKLNAYFVTVDPQRDTPAILHDYVSNVSDRIIGISGSEDKIAAVVKGFRVYAKKVPIDVDKPDGDYTMDHTASVFLLNNGGRFKGTIAYGEDPDVAVKKLENLIKG
jgi:protein SCO1